MLKADWRYLCRAMATLLIGIMLVAGAIPAIAGGTVVTTTAEIAGRLNGATFSGGTPWGLKRDSLKVTFEQNASGQLVATGHNDVSKIGSIDITEHQFSMTARIDAGTYGYKSMAVTVEFGEGWSIDNAGISIIRGCRSNCDGELSGALLATVIN